MLGIPVGREDELAAIARVLGRADRGSAAVVIEGEPGIGKTTLLRAGEATAREQGWRVLSCRPAEREAALPFVSLGDLLEPVLDEAAAALPPAQRAALETALARVAPTETFGRLAVSRATLALLRRLTAASPVLIAIDDAHWLDASTGAILEFALRRLAESPAFLLITRRSGAHEGLAGVPGERVEPIRLGPLSVDALGRVVAGHLEAPITRRTLGELHRRSGGNPYFALEILRAARDDAELPVPHDVAALVRERLAGLSAPARDALLLAAASPHPTTAAIERAAGGPDGVSEVLAAAILERDGQRLRFTHPMLASAVYGDAGPESRRAAHARLAAAALDPDERAVHLARATVLPDAAVAAELDAAAVRAYRRGAAAAAAELAEQAWRLTPDSLGEQRFVRALRSADFELAAGDTLRGREALERLLAERGRGPERAQVALRLGQVRYITDDVGAAHELFAAALADAGDDEALRAEAEQALAFTSMLAGDIPNAVGHSRTALARAERAGEPRVLALALCRAATNEFLAGQGLSREPFERALALEDTCADNVPVEWLPSYAYAWCCLMADDVPAARALYEPLARAAEDHADERFAVSVRFALSELELRAGNWARAQRLAGEAVERSRQSGLQTPRVWALHAGALVDIHLGRVEPARAAAAEALRIAGELRAVAPATQLTAALGLLELSRGDPAAAHAHLGPLSQLIASVGVAEPGVVRFMSNEIEALIALGSLDEAARLLALLRERAQRLDRISARAAAARCAALLAAARGELDEARAALAEALAQHERLDEPFELGRTLVAQGTVERRARGRAAARAALTRALELFDGLGAALWAERAAAELARIPGRTATAGLSASERRVAELVAQGLANKEIAARLYVTQRTVEAHLSRIYAKLGVRSRVELARSEMSGFPELPPQA